VQATTGGSDAVSFDILCEEDREKLKGIILDRLGDMFGIEDIESELAEQDIVCSSWSQLEDFGGAWFQFGPEATPADYEMLVQDQGNLIFSGESSCRRYYGFAHGGLIAGWRDANRVLEMINEDFGGNYAVRPETRCEMLPSNNGRYGGRWRVGRLRGRGGS